MQMGGGTKVPLKGPGSISVKDTDKQSAARRAADLIAMGFDIVATRGTAKYLQAIGLPVRIVNKVLEGRPHIVDEMKNGDISLVFNTTDGAQALADSASIRKTALQMKIPYCTTMTGAAAVTQAIPSLKAHSLEVAPLQSYA